MKFHNTIVPWLCTLYHIVNRFKQNVRCMTNWSLNFGQKHTKGSIEEDLRGDFCIMSVSQISLIRANTCLWHVIHDLDQQFIHLCKGKDISVSQLHYMHLWLPHAAHYVHGSIVWQCVHFIRTLCGAQAWAKPFSIVLHVETHLCLFKKGRNTLVLAIVPCQLAFSTKLELAM